MFWLKIRKKICMHSYLEGLGLKFVPLHWTSLLAPYYFFMKIQHALGTHLLGASMNARYYCDNNCFHGETHIFESYLISVK